MDLSDNKYKDDNAPEKNSGTEENEGPRVSASICDSSRGDLIDGKDREFTIEESDTEDEKE